MLDERIYQNYIGILKEEMVPAMGCTEPIALAYGAARAREVLGKEPEHITEKAFEQITISGNKVTFTIPACSVMALHITL